MKSAQPKIFCVIPNYNGAKDLAEAIDSLLEQSLACRVVVVDNGSKDRSRPILNSYGNKIDKVYNETNLGFAGGVNSGIKFSLKAGATHIALFNNDAIAEKDWLKNLMATFSKDSKIGIATGKIIKRGTTPPKFDTTGDMYSIWGLAFPRGRDEVDEGQYDRPEYVFGATGGASVYKREVFETVGLFDNDFFAYYEDIDISFRAQLRGFYVYYEPRALVLHAVGATSSKIPGFTAYHSTKNNLWVPLKNLPFFLLIRYCPRFWLAFSLLLVNQVKQGNLKPVSKGIAVAILLLPKKVFQRWVIQTRRRVDTSYIDSILVHDLPPDRKKLRKLRDKLKFWGKK